MQILSRTRQYPHPLKFCKRLVSEVWAEWGKLGSFSLRASNYFHKSFTPMDKKSLYFTNFPVHSTIITHNLHKLVRGDEGIKYPIIIKRDPFDEKSKTLQTTAKVDLREPDLILFLQRQPPGLKQQFWKRSQYTADFPLPRVFPIICAACSAAIVAEEKATASSASFPAAKN